MILYARDMVKPKLVFYVALPSFNVCCGSLGLVFIVNDTVLSCFIWFNTLKLYPYIYSNVA